MHDKLRPRESKVLEALARERFDILTVTRGNSLLPTSTAMLMAEMGTSNLRKTLADFEVEPVMGDFARSTVGNKTYWELHVCGKGEKDRWIPLPEEYLGYLKRYRKYRNLAPLPSPLAWGDFAHAAEETSIA